MTLQELKKYPLDKEYLEDLNERNVLNHRELHQRRLSNPDWIEYEIWNITHDGNNPRSNEDMLNIARCFIEENIYTDKQWNKYFIPAINEMIDYNNIFERWHPGYLIKNAKEDLAIVLHDYAEAFGGRDYTSLAVCDLDCDENIICFYAWEQYENWCLVSNEPEMVSKNLEKIRKYIIKRGYKAPIGINLELAKKLGYL